MKPTIITEPFRLFYQCECGEMIPKFIITKQDKVIPDTKSHFKSCYKCGRDMRRLGITTARRIITITRYGFLLLKKKREETYEYPQEERETKKSKIITLR